jgi:hypothetical protein
MTRKSKVANTHSDKYYSIRLKIRKHHHYGNGYINTHSLILSHKAQNPLTVNDYQTDNQLPPSSG